MTTATPPRSTPTGFTRFPSYCTATPGRYGTYLANPHDAYVGRSLLTYGEFSEGEVAVFTALLQPGDTVVEIGANVGALTLPLAQRVGPRGLVIAVEPQRPIFQMLAGMLALNGITNTLPIWAACGDATRSFIHVPRYDHTQPNNYGGVELAADVPSGELVWCPSLHDLLYTLDMDRPVTLLKVDVEGMEPQVMTGAEPILRQHRPVCYIECDRPHAEAPLRALFADHNYDVWWHLPPLFRPDNFAGVDENIWGADIRSINLLAVPAERVFVPPATWDCTPISAGSPINR